jgi:hypothetical protein
MACIALQFTRQASELLLSSTLKAHFTRTGNNWALVTGANDEWGLASADGFAHVASKVILHGSNRAKLERSASE